MTNKKYIAGLDIGRSSVKLVLLAKRNGGLHLVRAASKELPVTPETPGVESVSRAIRALASAAELKSSFIIASSNSPVSTVKQVKFPVMRRRELAAAVKMQAKGYFPFAPDTAYMDIEVSDEFSYERRTGKCDVLVSAAPIDMVNRCLAAVRGAGAEPDIFVPATYALARMARHIHDRTNTAACVIAMGGAVSEIVVFSSGSIFSRKISVSGNVLTKALTAEISSARGKTQLSFSEAEKVKREAGISAAGDTRMIDNRITAGEAMVLMRMPLEQLSDEIERCVNYCREELDMEGISSVLLTGGGSLMKGLPEFLSKELSMEVKLADPFEGLTGAHQTADTGAAAPCIFGVAAGAALTPASAANLLPPDIKVKKSRAFVRNAAIVTIFAAAVLLASIYSGVRTQLGIIRAENAAIKQELSKLDIYVGSTDAGRVTSKLLKEEPRWEAVFKEFGNLTPPNIYFTSLDIKDKRVLIGGVVESQDPEGSLSKYVLSLEGGVFRDAKLISTKENAEKTGNEFILECYIE